MKEPDEVIEGAGSPEQSLVARVLSREPLRCAGCGSVHKLRVALIVPIAQGGQYTESNATVLCSLCQRAHIPSAERERRYQGEFRYLNVWVSAALGNRVMQERDTGRIASVNALICAVISRYVELPHAYPDLTSYVDAGTETKLNARVDAALYVSFQRLAEETKTTVTDAVKALLLIYLRDHV